MKLNLINISLLLYSFFCYKSVNLPKDQQRTINISPNKLYYLTEFDNQNKDIQINIQIKFSTPLNNTGNPFQFYFIIGSPSIYRMTLPSNYYENNNYSMVNFSFSFPAAEFRQIVGFISSRSIENATLLYIDPYVETNNDKINALTIIVIVIVIIAFLYILIKHFKTICNCIPQNQNEHLLPQNVQQP